MTDASTPDAARPLDGGLNDCVGAVYFEDPTLAAAVRSTLGIEGSQPISAASMLELEDLRIEQDDSAAKLFSLIGLECALNLRLIVDDNGGSISDLSPLLPLNLMGLYLRNHNISSLEPLRGSSHLDGVDLGGNRISDISPIVGDENYGFLFFTLDGNEIEDLSPLLDLNFHCAQIDVTNNPLSDDSVMTAIPQLCDRFEGSNSFIKWSGGSGSSCSYGGCILG